MKILKKSFRDEVRNDSYGLCEIIHDNILNVTHHKKKQLKCGLNKCLSKSFRDSAFFYVI